MSERLVYLTETDQREWSARHARGLVPCALPYGAECLRGLGWEVQSATHPEPVRRTLRRVNDRLSTRLPAPAYASAAWLGAFWRADVVVAALEHAAAGPAAWKRFGTPVFRGTPLVALTCWLTQELLIADSARRAELRRRFTGIDLLAVFSTNQVDTLRELGPVGAEVIAVPFGVDTDFFTAEPRRRDIDVLAVGRDWGRDYATLFAAAHGLDAPIDIVCPTELRAAAPPNVRFHAPVSHVDYRTLLSRAKVVVVPTKTFAYPTGQSVALEAASCGALVVVSDTPAMRDYFTPGVNALMPSPERPEELRGALETALSDDQLSERLASEGLSHVRRAHDTAALWRALDQELRRRGWCGRRSLGSVDGAASH